MNEKVAMMLAKCTAGRELDPATSRGGVLQTVNTVMAAAGLGKAGRIGTLILLANYQDSTDCRRWAEDWLLKWAWFQWLKLNRRDTRVTIDEMARVVSVAMGQHIDPRAARQTSRRMAAEIIGVHPSTYAKKYEIMHSKLTAEIQFQESIASTAILTKMGGDL